MTTPAQRRETPTPYPAAKSVAEARKLAENLMEVMSALLSVINARRNWFAPASCAKQ